MTPTKAKRGAEVLKTIAHGPDGQVRFPGQAPAEEWYSDDHAWFLEDLRTINRLVDGDEDIEQAQTVAGTAWPSGSPTGSDAELAAASVDRGRAGSV